MTVRASARPLAARRWGLRRVLLDDVALKAAAMGVALALWLVAAGASGRETTRTFDGRLPVERPEVPAGYVARGALGDVAVRLRGTDVVLAKVTSADLHASVDLGAVDLGPGGSFELPVRVVADTAGVAVVDVAPAMVTLRIERLASRTVAVQASLANSPPAGWVAGTPVLSPREVGLDGPESAVAQVAAVTVSVRFGDAPLDVVQTAQPIPVDAAGAPVDGVRVEPKTVEVRVAVLPEATTRSVPVVPVLRGAPAPGWWLAGVAVDPLVVVVRGSQAALGALGRLNTLPLDVGGLAGDRVYSTSVALPAGVTLAGPAEVTVRVAVTPLTGTRAYSLAVAVASLPMGLAAEVETRAVEVVLAGPQTQLAAVTAEQLAVTIDVAGLGVGTHQVPVVVAAPAGLAVTSVQPPRATVTIRSR